MEQRQFSLSYIIKETVSLVPYSDAKIILVNENIEFIDEVFCCDECKLVDTIIKNETGQITSNSYELFVPVEIMSNYIK